MFKSNSPFEYIFESGKLLGPFPNGISAEQYIRGKFLDMYKINQSLGYFTNQSVINSFWKRININLDNPDAVNSFINSATYNSPWLDFIKVK